MSGAIISGCGRYRYTLRRTTNQPGFGTTAVIMVNPSTADAVENDATIRKVLGFCGHKWWGDIIVVNLFAYRATDVRELARVEDPVGPDNARYIGHAMDIANRVVVAWGASGKLPRRLRNQFWQVVGMAGFRDIELLSIGEPLADGHPRHPLMASYELPILPWAPPSC